MGKRLLSFVIAFMCVFSVGCAGNTDTAVQTDDGNKITVTDLAGREVEMTGDVEKVVITFNLEEYLAVTGAEGIDKLVGYSHSYWQGRREDAWKTYTDAFPQLKTIQDVGYNDDINVEQIIALSPDVVFMSMPVNFKFMEPQLSKFEDVGIPVVFFDFHAQTLEKHRESMELIGKVMGNEARGAEIADYYEKQMQIVYDRVATLSDEEARPRVYMEFSKGPQTYGNSWSNKMWGALIGTCGGDNIAAELGEGNSIDVAPEQVIAADPEVIIFTASPQTDINDNIVLGYGADEASAKAALASYENRDGWASLSAVQSGRMSAVYHDLSRHIFDFAGAQFIAKQIHPDLFEDIDPVANLKEFFDTYMPVSLDGVWLVTLDAE